MAGRNIGVGARRKVDSIVDPVSINLFISTHFNELENLILIDIKKFCLLLFSVHRWK